MDFAAVSQAHSICLDRRVVERPEFFLFSLGGRKQGAVELLLILFPSVDQPYGDELFRLVIPVKNPAGDIECAAPFALFAS